MRNYKTHLRAQAKQLYFSTARTQKSIAKTIGISEQTMSAWVRKEGWASAKKAKYHSPEEELQQLYQCLRVINDNINQRDYFERIPTKEELEAKTKILALIAGPLKNVADNWRNVTPEYSFEEEEKKADDEMPDVETEVTYKGKPIGKIKMGSIPIRRKLKDGMYAYDVRTLHDYYMKIAALYVAADQGSKEYFKGGDDFVAPGLQYIREAVGRQEARDAKQNPGSQ